MACLSLRETAVRRYEQRLLKLNAYTNHLLEAQNCSTRNVTARAEYRDVLEKHCQSISLAMPEPSESHPKEEIDRVLAEELHALFASSVSPNDAQRNGNTLLHLAVQVYLRNFQNSYDYLKSLDDERRFSRFAEDNANPDEYVLGRLSAYRFNPLQVDGEGRTAFDLILDHRIENAGSRVFGRNVKSKDEHKVLSHANALLYLLFMLTTEVHFAITEMPARFEEMLGRQVNLLRELLGQWISYLEQHIILLSKPKEKHPRFAQRFKEAIAYINAAVTALRTGNIAAFYSTANAVYEHAQQQATTPMKRAKHAASQLHKIYRDRVPHSRQQPYVAAGYTSSKKEVAFHQSEIHAPDLGNWLFTDGSQQHHRALTHSSGQLKSIVLSSDTAALNRIYDHWEQLRLERQQLHELYYTLSQSKSSLMAIPRLTSSQAIQSDVESCKPELRGFVEELDNEQSQQDLQPVVETLETERLDLLGQPAFPSRQHKEPVADNLIKAVYADDLIALRAMVADQDFLATYYQCVMLPCLRDTNLVIYHAQIVAANAAIELLSQNNPPALGSQATLAGYRDSITSTLRNVLLNYRTARREKVDDEQYGVRDRQVAKWLQGEDSDGQSLFYAHFTQRTMYYLLSAYIAKSQRAHYLPYVFSTPASGVFNVSDFALQLHALRNVAERYNKTPLFICPLPGTTGEAYCVGVIVNDNLLLFSPASQSREVVCTLSQDDQKALNITSASPYLQLLQLVANHLFRLDSTSRLTLHHINMGVIGAHADSYVDGAICMEMVKHLLQFETPDELFKGYDDLFQRLQSENEVYFADLSDDNDALFPTSLRSLKTPTRTQSLLNLQTITSIHFLELHNFCASFGFMPDIDLAQQLDQQVYQHGSQAEVQQFLQTECGIANDRYEHPQSAVAWTEAYGAVPIDLASKLRFMRKLMFLDDSQLLEDEPSHPEVLRSLVLDGFSLSQDNEALLATLQQFRANAIMLYEHRMMQLNAVILHVTSARLRTDVDLSRPAFKERLFNYDACREQYPEFARSVEPKQSHVELRSMLCLHGLYDAHIKPNVTFAQKQASLIHAAVRAYLRTDNPEGVNQPTAVLRELLSGNYAVNPLMMNNAGRTVFQLIFEYGTSPARLNSDEMVARHAPVLNLLQQRLMWVVTGNRCMLSADVLLYFPLLASHWQSYQEILGAFQKYFTGMVYEVNDESGLFELKAEGIDYAVISRSTGLKYLAHTLHSLQTGNPGLLWLQGEKIYQSALQGVDELGRVHSNARYRERTRRLHQANRSAVHQIYLRYIKPMLSQYTPQQLLLQEQQRGELLPKMRFGYITPQDVKERHQQWADSSQHILGVGGQRFAQLQNAADKHLTGRLNELVAYADENQAMLDEILARHPEVKPIQAPQISEGVSMPSGHESEPSSAYPQHELVMGHTELWVSSQGSEPTEVPLLPVDDETQGEDFVTGPGSDSGGK